MDSHRQRIKRVMRSAPGTEPIREAKEIRLVDGVEDFNDGSLYDFVFQCCYA